MHFQVDYIALLTHSKLSQTEDPHCWNSSKILCEFPCGDPESFVRVQLWQRFFFFFFFSLMRGASIQLPLLTSHQRPVIETPFKWRFTGGPMMAQHWMLNWKLCDFKGLRTSIAKDTFIFVTFQGGGGSGPPVLPLDPHMISEPKPV